MNTPMQSVLWNDGPSDPRTNGTGISFFSSDYSKQQYPSDPSIPTGFGGPSYAAPSPFSSEEDRPLLEELGVDFQHIKRKSRMVCNPFRPCMDPTLLQDTDLAGPLFFAVALGTVLLLTGKVHFGYIFGMGMGGCVSIYALLNVMTDKAVDLQYTVSTLGYCLVPIVILGALRLISSVPWYVGYVVSGMFILWSSWCATKMFVDSLSMLEQRWLIMYPVTLLYSTFALISIF
eukprot:NODE_6979_length_821_cov_153.683381_g6378_i0.p1 GENE.NODE_6979_length_821_cov_153.683381_g6378_i0~~NODE_6979_length_821_cov_153.683381_g6378_i0.p1  ORF type:complete len:232 (-),score=23.74 NODE_6979_length_821_cov_153.683381_g6378_i0:69-764(-)